jgi:hypothetical protein
VRRSLRSHYSHTFRAIRKFNKRDPTQLWPIAASVYQPGSVGRIMDFERRVVLNGHMNIAEMPFRWIGV